MQLTAWISPVFPFDREVAQDFTNLHPFFPAAIWFWELWQRRVLPAAFTGSMALSAQPVVPAAAAVATVAEAAAGAQPTSQLFTCKWCGLGYSGEQGRLHGNVFTCLPCNTHERSLRRNLGTDTGLQQFSVEETHSFFRKLLQKKSETANGRLQYATVRAVLVNSVTERTVNSYKGQVSCSELPLSVYVQQGWAPDVVEKCPKVWSDKFGVYCYQVPVKTQTWAQCFERIESKLLQQEKEITKRKGKSTKDDPDDLDVPVSAAADKASSSKKEAKQAEAQARKLLQENHKISTVAAKALGPLVQSEASLRACQEKVEKASVGEQVLLVSRPLSLKLESWAKAAREAVNCQDNNRQKPEGAEVIALVPLPWTAEDMKATLKQAATVVKELKACLPKKEKRAAQQPAEQPSAVTQPAPKRRRTKAPAWVEAVCWIREMTPSFLRASVHYPARTAFLTRV